MRNYQKRRYAVMKKYFRLYQPYRTVLEKPCKVDIYGKEYICFCNALTMALTTEDIGKIELCDTPERYPKVEHLVKFDGIKSRINFEDVIKEAKEKKLQVAET